MYTLAIKFKDTRKFSSVDNVFLAIIVFGWHLVGKMLKLIKKNNGSIKMSSLVLIQVSKNVSVFYCQITDYVHLAICLICQKNVRFLDSIRFSFEE